jgi:DNA-binding transcriptional LysR family regulator
MVVYSPEAPQSRVIVAWLEKFGIARQVAVEVRSGYAACAMAASGAGVAFVDNLSARAHRSENLELLKIPDAPNFAIYSVTNVNRPPSQLGQTFLELVAGELASLS